MAFSFGKALIVTGVVLVVTGGLVLLLGRFGKLGHLPLDLRIERGTFRFYFPLGTMLLVSLVLTLLLNLVLRLRR